MHEKRVCKKIAVITGASAGLGAEFARQLDGYGLDELWVLARRRERLEDLAMELTTEVKILECDLTSKGQVEKVLGGALREETPEIVYAINNAGFGKVGPVVDLSLEHQLGMVDLNCRSVVDVAHRCLEYMTEGSTLVNVSSTAGFGPLGAFAVYGATKAFVTSLSVALQAELKDRGMQVLAVCPGPTETEFSKVAHEGSTKNDSVFSKKGSAKGVVALALKDIRKKKTFSIKGIQFKILSFVVRFIPMRVVAQTSYAKVMRSKIE